MILTLIVPRQIEPPYSAVGLQAYIDGVFQERLYSVSGDMIRPSAARDACFWLYEKSGNLEKWRMDIECDAEVVTEEERGLKLRKLKVKKIYAVIPKEEAIELKKPY